MFQFRGTQVGVGSFVLAVSAASYCWGCGQQALSLKVAPASLDTKVYAALLDKALAGKHGKIVLERESVGFDMKDVSYAYLFPKQNTDAAPSPNWGPRGGPAITMKEWKEASESFRFRNLRSVALPLDGAKLIPFTRTGEVAGRHSFDKDSPSATGFLSLSRPGYSANGRVALVAFDISWGRKSAEQDFAVLELGEKGWIVAKAVVIAMA